MFLIRNSITTFVLVKIWVSKLDQTSKSTDNIFVFLGGQGDGTGKVAIWNMAPVRDEKDELDENVPKILCQMDNHLACVNCVRWSNNGKYLASAGDDKIIMIWQASR